MARSYIFCVPFRVVSEPRPHEPTDRPSPCFFLRNIRHTHTYTYMLPCERSPPTTTEFAALRTYVRKAPTAVRRRRRRRELWQTAAAANGRSKGRRRQGRKEGRKGPGQPFRPVLKYSSCRVREGLFRAVRTVHVESSSSCPALLARRRGPTVASIFGGETFFPALRSGQFIHCKIYMVVHAVSLVTLSPPPPGTSFGRLPSFS